MEIYSHLYQRFLGFIDQFTAAPQWKMKTLVLCFILVNIITMPDYHEMFVNHSEENHTWQTIKGQSEHLFAPIQADPKSHEGNVQYRILVPALVGLLGLNSMGYLWFQFFLGLLMIWLAIDFIHQATQSKRFTVFFALAFTFIYAGKAAFIEHRFMYDSVALCILFVGLRYPNWALQVGLAILAGFTDERGIIASFVFVIDRLLRQDKKLLVAFVPILAVPAYLMLRFAISSQFGLPIINKGVGLGFFVKQVNNIPLGMFVAFEGFWLLLITSLLLLLQQKKYFIALVVASFSFFQLITAFTVFDISRSLTYAFPVMLTLYVYVHRHTSKSGFETLALVIMLVSLAFPAVNVDGKNTVTWLPPFFLRMAMLLGG